MERSRPGDAHFGGVLSYTCPLHCGSTWASVRLGWSGTVLPRRCLKAARALQALAAAPCSHPGKPLVRAKALMLSALCRHGLDTLSTGAGQVPIQEAKLSKISALVPGAGHSPQGARRGWLGTYHPLRPQAPAGSTGRSAPFPWLLEKRTKRSDSSEQRTKGKAAACRNQHAPHAPGTQGKGEPAPGKTDGREGPDPPSASQAGAQPEPSPPALSQGSTAPSRWSQLVPAPCTEAPTAARAPLGPATALTGRLAWPGLGHRPGQQLAAGGGSAGGWHLKVTSFIMGIWLAPAVTPCPPPRSLLHALPRACFNLPQLT